MTVAIKSPVTITATKDGPAKVVVVGYTGGAMRVYGFSQPVVLDLMGMHNDRKTIPFLRDHDMGRPVGHVTDLKVINGELHVTGFLSHVSKDRDEVLAAAERGYPWQASLGSDPAVDGSGHRLHGAIEHLPAGKTAHVNEREFVGPVTIFRKWTLVEVSIAALGADGNTLTSIAAKKGERNMNVSQLLESINVPRETLDEIERAIQDEVEQKTEESASEIAARYHNIQRICANHPAIAEKAIREKWTEEQAELAVFRNEGLRAKHNAPIGNPPTIHNEHSNTVDLLLARYGHGDVKAVKGRMPKLVDIARESLVECGMTPPDNVEDLVRAGLQMPVVRAAASSTNLPYVLENFSRRVIEDAYRESPQTFWPFVKKIYVPDFRLHNSIRVNAVGNLEPLTDGGEIKHGNLTEESVYPMMIDSFAKLISLTRKDIINDDLRVFNDLGSSMGRAASRTLADLVYRTLLDAPADFFSTDHNNLLAGSESELNVDSLQTAIGKLRTMRDSDGNDLDIRPAVLLVPVELEFFARQLLDSVSVQWLGDPSEMVSKPAGNSLKDALQIAVEPRLSNPKFNGASTKTWYLFSDASTAAMAVAFLPGKDGPTVENFGLQQTVDRLAYTWRVFHDFGAALGDWRGVVKAIGE